MFLKADAHEGCVWVPRQRRLYFTTTKKLDEPRVGLRYLDFSEQDFNSKIEDVPEQEWLHDARMANSFILSNDGKALIVAEQGDHERPAAIARYELDSKRRTEIATGINGKPFNSPNKVKQLKNGDFIVSDPDYGFRQGFRPPPQLEPGLYYVSQSGEVRTLDCRLEMPHGIALSPDEQTLFVTDTSNDGAHEDKSIQLHRRRHVYAYPFDPERREVTGEPVCRFGVDEGVPDGCFVSRDRLLVGGGDGVYVADLNGKLLEKIPLERTAVNLCVVDNRLFVTADEGVYVLNILD